MEEIKTEGQLLQDKLFYNTKNAWEKSSEDFKAKPLNSVMGIKAF